MLVGNTLGDEQLARLARQGDARAFERLCERHRPALVAFCRHRLGSHEDAEEAVQDTLMRAHAALLARPAPAALRPWLFAIARNRCLTMLSRRRPVAVPLDETLLGVDGPASQVARRAELAELLRDVATLPADQREALVLTELGGLSHADAAALIGCRPAKVKALVFQARATLTAVRDARETPCEEIRDVLETAAGGALRRGGLRRHLRGCAACSEHAITGRTPRERRTPC
jgi:RNA polymerase sigma factor (sigma-70 family)